MLKSSKKFNNMKPVDLDTMKAAWKSEKSFEDHRLSEEDIERYLHKGSKDISQLFRKGLYFDIFLKGLSAAALVALGVLFRENLNLILLIAGILLITFWTIRYQWLLIGKIPEIHATSPVIRTTLEQRISFYHRHYIKSLYVGAFSNVLLIFSGMLYYFYFKYGELRPMQWDDYLVFAAVILIGYFTGVSIQIAQHNFQVRQLESSLREIDENSLNSYTVRQQRNRKRRMTLIFLLALICGLLLLAYLVFR